MLHIDIQTYHAAGDQMNNFTSMFEPPEVPDYYADLGLQYTATYQEIKRAHHSLAKKHHPDKQGLGVCVDAYEFRKVREAYEFLRDPSNRSTYDTDYPQLQERWAQFRIWKETQRRDEEAKLAEEISRRRKAAEAEMARHAEEKQRVAREKAAREREARRQSEEEREILRKLKEEWAERRTQEAACRARKEQEHAARERLRIQKEREAEQKSREAARKARLEQELAADARLKAILTAERHDFMGKDWAKMREAAERRKLTSIRSEVRGPLVCNHPRFGWRKKKGKVSCVFCGEKCSKFHFHCPECDSKACQACKTRYCTY